MVEKPQAAERSHSSTVKIDSDEHLLSIHFLPFMQDLSPGNGAARSGQVFQP